MPCTGFAFILMFIKNETALLPACSAGIAPRLAGTSCPSRSLLSPGSLRDLLRPLTNSLPMWVDVGARVMETQPSAQTLEQVKTPAGTSVVLKHKDLVSQERNRHPTDSHRQFSRSTSRSVEGGTCAMASLLLETTTWAGGEPRFLL